MKSNIASDFKCRFGGESLQGANLDSGNYETRQDQGIAWVVNADLFNAVIILETWFGRIG
jgi:hypothetical protein